MSDVRPALGPDGVAALQAWAAEVEAWPAGSHVWGQYAEHTPAGDVMCRTENVSACHAGVAALVDGRLRELAAEWAGGPVESFKDKLNYKQPGGGGFSPHQDLRAYPGVGNVTSVLVAIDACTVESGCLWMAEGVRGLLATDERGVVRAETCATLTWHPVELAPGEAVGIDGLVPHYSEANGSAHARRVLIASYAPVTARYRRADYYAARDAQMRRASAADGRDRISTLADFDGSRVTTGAPAVSVCTHT
jgi:hypothetical protein